MGGVGYCVAFWIVLYGYLLRAMVVSDPVKYSNVDETFFFHKLRHPSLRESNKL